MGAFHSLAQGILAGRELSMRMQQAADDHLRMQQELQDAQTKASIQDVMNRMTLASNGRPVVAGTVQDQMNLSQPDTVAGASPGSTAPPSPSSDPGVPDMLRAPTDNSVTTDQVNSLPMRGTVIPGGQQSYSFVRKPDSSRLVTYKDSQGNSHQYELLTPEEQIQRKQQLTAQQQFAEARTKAQAAYEGRKAALGIPGNAVTLPDDVAKELGYEPGYQVPADQVPEVISKAREAQSERLANQQKQLDLDWINQQNNAAALNPQAVGSAVDSIIDPKKYPALNQRTKQEYQAVLTTAPPSQRRQSGMQVLTKAADRVNEMEAQTDPSRLEFDKKKAREVASATAQGQIDALNAAGGGGENPTARGLADYQIEPLSARSLATPAGQNLMRQVLAINPDYQASQYGVAKDTEKAFTSGAPSKSVNALNTVIGHLDELDRAATALKNNDIQALNRIANAFGAQTGKTAKTTYDAIVHKVGPELTTAYTASGGSVGERGTNEEDFSSSLSPDQIRSNISTSVKLLDSKLRALQDQYSRGTYGRGKQQLISREAEATRQRLLGGAGTAAGSAYSMTATGKEGHKIGSNDGKTWFDLQTNQPVK